VEVPGGQSPGSTLWSSGRKTIKIVIIFSLFYNRTPPFAFYLCNAEQIGEIAHGHWSIENQLHWVLVVDFGEDEDRQRKNHSPENLNVLRKATIAALKGREPEKKHSFKRLMFKTLMKDDCRSSLIFGS
jgi:hypothetical protein